MMATLGEIAGIALITAGFWIATNPGVALIVLGALIYVQAQIYSLPAPDTEQEADRP